MRWLCHMSTINFDNYIFFSNTRPVGGTANPNCLHWDGSVTRQSKAKALVIADHMKCSGPFRCRWYRRGCLSPSEKKIWKNDAGYLLFVTIFNYAFDNFLQFLQLKMISTRMLKSFNKKIGKMMQAKLHFSITRFQKITIYSAADGWYRRGYLNPPEKKLGKLCR